MADVQRSARLYDATIGLEGSQQKFRELFGAHAIALNRQVILGVAFIARIVRRIAKNEIREFIIHKPIHVRSDGRITDKYSMFGQ